MKGERLKRLIEEQRENLDKHPTDCLSIYRADLEYMLIWLETILLEQQPKGDIVIFTNQTRLLVPDANDDEVFYLLPTVRVVCKIKDEELQTMGLFPFADEMTRVAAMTRAHTLARWLREVTK